MPESDRHDHPVLYTLFGFNRAGRILYATLLVVAAALLTARTLWWPGLQFHDEEERLFRAARHGDVAGVERALAGGGHVNATAPIDGKTALFRAAVFGHADVVRVLLRSGADPSVRGNDGRTALEVVLAARAEENDPARAGALDAVASALREAGGSR